MSELSKWINYLHKINVWIDYLILFLSGILIGQYTIDSKLKNKLIWGLFILFAFVMKKLAEQI